MNASRPEKIFVRSRCSNSCIFCSDDFGEMKREDEIILLNRTKNLIDSGVSEVIIFGAEALTYSKILNYLGWIRKFFKKITLRDPGMMLSNPVIASSLVKLGISFDIPIYGSKASIHDAVTRNIGSFDKVIQGINNLKGFSSFKDMVSLHTILTSKNYENIPELIIYCNESIGLDNIMVSLPDINANISKLEDFALDLDVIRKTILNTDKRYAFYLGLAPCIFSEEDFKLISHVKIVSEKKNDAIDSKICLNCYLFDKICSGMPEYYSFYKSNKFFPISEKTYETNNILFNR